jgi:ribosomal protein S14
MEVSMTIPEGLTRCDRCGELKGTFLYAAWYDPEPRPTPVRCVCDGIECRVCGRRAAVHRPLSNYYVEDQGVVIHVPYFMGMAPTCHACRKEESRRS